ncbi:hypothetical protein C8Q76DRAFT_719653, partial [Earliella scabrosa]
MSSFGPPRGPPHRPRARPPRPLKPPLAPNQTDQARKLPSLRRVRSASQSRSRAEPSTRVRATTTVKGTLPGAPSTSSSSVPPSGPSKTRPHISASGPASEQADDLQTAAQSCAWAYMTSSLEDELGKATKVARAAVEARQQKLDLEEADIAESRVRYEAERLLEFYDELSDRQIAHEVAAIIKGFRTLERTVGDVTAATLRLTSLPLDDTTHVSQYNVMLDMIESVEGQCESLKVQLSSLSQCVITGEGRLSSVLSNIFALLQGHSETAAFAKSVVQRCKENYRIGVETLTL